MSVSQTSGSTGQRAQETADEARTAASRVTGTAKDQAGEVAQEAKQQARDLLGETKSQLSSQAVGQRDRAVGSMRQLSDELSSMADSSAESGIATELARQASGRLSTMAGYLEDREPGDLLDDLRSYAARHPGTFLLGAAVAGLVVGRATRSGIALAQDRSASSTGSGTGGYGGTDVAGLGRYPNGSPPAAMPPVAYEDQVGVSGTGFVGTEPPGPLPTSGQSYADRPAGSPAYEDRP